MTKKSGHIDDALLDAAISKWGTNAQIEVIQEECLELALALQQLKRKRGDREEKIANIEDEIADVKITTRQAERIFNQERINARVDYKMNRLKNRIENKNEES